MIEVRPAVVEDFEAFFSAMSNQFGFDYDDEKKRAEHQARFLEYADFERAFLAEDSGQIVGTLGAFAFDMTVPGGSIACAGTTQVTVVPTHRRQGVLRSLISAHLKDSIDREDSIAALLSSDSAIYGRFGYGLASEELTLRIDRANAAFGRLAPTPSRVELVTTERAHQEIPAVYERVRTSIPGAFARSKGWWKHRTFRDSAEARDGRTALRFALSTNPDGKIDGYVMYRIKDGWEHSHGAQEVHVIELMAESPESHAGLYQALFGHDLATVVVVNRSPVDNPILNQLAGRRRAAQTVDDNLWVRLLDIPAALTGRTYSSGGSLTMSVHDPLTGESSGWKLETDGMESACTSFSGATQLVLDIEDLGGALLGRARFAELLRSGRIATDRETAIRADAMFTHHRAACCPEMF